MTGSAATDRSTTPWWRTYFDDIFYALHSPLFTEEETRREAGAAIELLGLPLGATILDAPCGWGRHTRLFTEAGLHAVGADLSVPLLRRAAASLRDADAAARLAAADLRALPFRDAAFDGAVHLFTSLGLFQTEEDDRRALAEIRRVLRPDGRFLLETMHRDDVVSHYAERDRWALPDGTEVRVRRRFDAVRGLSHERWEWRRGEERGMREHTLRLRTATGIDRLLRAAGFVRVRYFGDWSGDPFSHDSPRLLAVARRSG